MNLTGFFGESSISCNSNIFNESKDFVVLRKFRLLGFWSLTKNGRPEPKTKLDLSSPPIQVNFAVVPPNFSKI